MQNNFGDIKYVVREARFIIIQQYKCSQFFLGLCFYIPVNSYVHV